MSNENVHNGHPEGAVDKMATTEANASTPTACGRKQLAGGFNKRRLALMAAAVCRSPPRGTDDEIIIAASQEVLLNKVDYYDVNKQCSCGSEKPKTVFTLVGEYTGKAFGVGSCCIERFIPKEEYGTLSHLYNRAHQESSVKVTDEDARRIRGGTFHTPPKRKSEREATGHTQKVLRAMYDRGRPVHPIDAWQKSQRGHQTVPTM